VPGKKTKKMKQLSLVGFLALVITCVACDQSPPKDAKRQVTTETPKNWKLIDKPVYTVQYPDSFELDTSRQMGMSFMLLSKQLSDHDLFRENVNLIMENLPGKQIDLEKYIEISLGQIEMMITDINLIESKKITDKNGEYQKIIYTGKQGQYSLKWQQRYWVENNKAYILTLTCEVDQYDHYLTAGEDIMKTFRIK